ncbi:uncharacterized protein METZ01_LOCUS374513, partial [marine metagenome]
QLHILVLWFQKTETENKQWGNVSFYYFMQDFL